MTQREEMRTYIENDYFVLRVMKECQAGRAPLEWYAALTAELTAMIEALP